MVEAVLFRPVYTKEISAIGVGMRKAVSNIMATEKHLIIPYPIPEIGKLISRAIWNISVKFDFAAYYSLYSATIGILSASHIGNVNDLNNSINNQTPSVTDDFTYSIKNPKQKVQHHLAKLNYNYYFKDGQSLAFQYAFQFNNRKEFDLRTGVADSKPALDLNLITHTVNADYKLSFSDWDFKSGILGLYQTTPQILTPEFVL